MACGAVGKVTGVGSEKDTETQMRRDTNALAPAAAAQTPLPGCQDKAPTTFPAPMEMGRRQISGAWERRRGTWPISLRHGGHTLEGKVTGLDGKVTALDDKVTALADPPGGSRRKGSVGL